MIRIKKLVIVRRFSQVIFLGLFVYILWSTTYPLEGALPAETFFSLDPLIIISTSIAERVMLTGLGIAVVINPADPIHAVQDGAAATQNMLLAAHALGLGACWISAYDMDFEGDAKRILGIPEEERLLSVISVGHPAEIPLKEKKALEEIKTVA